MRPTILSMNNSPYVERSSGVVLTVRLSLTVPKGTRNSSLFVVQTCGTERAISYLSAAQLTIRLLSLYTQSMEKSSARWWDLLSAVFLFLAILFSAWRLQSTNWTDGLEHVRNVALLGLLVGLALGSSMYQKRGVIFLAISYMLVIFIWQWLGAIEFAKEETYLGDRLLILAGRLLLGLSEFSAGRPVKDPLFFIALLCIPYWFTALISGYQMTRHANALAAVLPGGILMFMIFILHYTAHDYSWLFGAYLFVTLLFLGRQKYLMDRKRWGERRVQIPAESGMDFNNTIMTSAAIAILLVWMFPATLPSNAQAKEAWQETSKKWFSKNERLENVFAAAKQDNLPVRDFYRDNLPLGTQARQSAAIAFLVYAPSPAMELPRLYWRGRVYDRFEDGRWFTTGVKGVNYEPQNGDFEISDTQNRINLNFTFSVYLQGQTILYTAAQPLWVSHPANIVYKKIPIEEKKQGAIEDINETMDIVALQAAPHLAAGETYHTNALIANPAISELRAAGQEYPAWVTDEYLQLPDNFSARIQALAFEITAAQDNPYDKAVAITNYLRTEIKYKPSISFPEQPVDPLEYFLFDVKQGFCNYYASAETLMLRSIGIPARLAVGFAQGEANLQNTFYTVRERDAHAWPEVYFPNYGWIEFEPTVNQVALERPEKTEETPAAISTLVPLEADPITQETPIAQPDEKPVEIISRAQIIQLSLAVGGFLLVFVVILLKKRYAPDTQTTIILKAVLENNGWNTPAWLNRWIRWTALTPIERSFQSINTGLNWMGNPQPVHVTPAERAGVLMELIPASAPSIKTLLREHQSAMFSPHGGDVSLTRRAAWKILYQIIALRLKIFIFG